MPPKLVLTSPTGNISKYNEKLNIPPVLLQFTEFYSREVIFTEGEFEYLFHILPFLQFAVNFDKIIKGIPLTFGGLKRMTEYEDQTLIRSLGLENQPNGVAARVLLQHITHILEEKRLLEGNTIPTENIIPLYDLLMFRSKGITRTINPRAVGESDYDYLLRLAEKSDRYDVLQDIPLVDATVMLWPGRAWTSSTSTQFHEPELEVSLDYFSRFVRENPKLSIRRMSGFEIMSKTYNSGFET